MGEKNNASMVSEQIPKKTFNYSIGNISLGFTLRVDVKDDLEIFSRLLAKAHQDVLIEISK